MFGNRQFVVIGLSVFASAIFFNLVGCDKAARYKVLTFFFTGVPDPNGKVPVTSTSAVGSRQQMTQPEVVKPAFYTHEPYWRCQECHGERKTSGFSREVQLIAQVPQLCYKCHGDRADEERYNHAPILFGKCLFCHDPHRNKNENLLRKKEPDICYQCHTSELIEPLPQHKFGSDIKCTKCHAVHGSQRKHLLKKDKEIISRQREEEDEQVIEADEVKQELMLLLESNEGT